jgi:hypothetical protein
MLGSTATGTWFELPVPAGGGGGPKLGVDGAIGVWSEVGLMPTMTEKAIAPRPMTTTAVTMLPTSMNDLRSGLGGSASYGSAVTSAVSSSPAGGGKSGWYSVNASWLPVIDHASWGSYEPI